MKYIKEAAPAIVGIIVGIVCVWFLYDKWVAYRAFLKQQRETEFEANVYQYIRCIAKPSSHIVDGLVWTDFGSQIVSTSTDDIKNCLSDVFDPTN